MNLYTVTVLPKRASFSDRGAQFEVEAENRAQAISQARRRVARECLYDRHDGPLVYSAIPAA